MANPLDPTWLNRLSQRLRPQWAHTVAARRIAAAALAVLAAASALRPDPDGDEAVVVVAARDLTPGTTLADGDVRTESRPRPTIPDGARTTDDAVLGATLTGPARRGEVITDVRLLSNRLAEVSTGVPDARTVPLQLPETALLDMIRTGDVVDVLAEGAPGDEPGSTPRPHIIATAAVVVLVSPAAAQRGPGASRVVLVALPAATANTVAGIALTEQVTLTFH